MLSDSAVGHAEWRLGGEEAHLICQRQWAVL